MVWKGRLNPARGRGVACLLLACAVVTGPRDGIAQRISEGSSAETYPIPESVRMAHMMRVAPHYVVLTPSQRSATIEVSNPSDKSLDADVEIQYAYPRLLNIDTTLFSPQWKQQRTRDSVIEHPGPGERYAGQWLRGLPAHITLKAHERRKVFISIVPPAELQDGEYTARIMTVVRSPMKNKPNTASDSKTRYSLPVTGQPLPTIRDSVRVFYQTGALRTGIEVSYVRAQQDMESRPTPSPEFGDRQLWLILRMRPLGNVPFYGTMTLIARNDATGEEFSYSPAFEFALYKPGIRRHWAQTSMLVPGKYHMIIRFTSGSAIIPDLPRVPMTPVEVSVPFVIEP